MRTVSLAVIALSVLLSACATKPYPREETLREQVCQLDGFWEISTEWRTRWIDEHCSESTSEDYLSLPAEGAQCALTCVRLEKDVLAVVMRTELMKGSSNLHVMKKADHGWVEVTPMAFPYPLTGRLDSVMAHADKSLTVKASETGAVERYLWQGDKFVPTE